MADKSKIEWTDASWTPIRARNLTTGKIGWHCEHATTGCEFCYSEGMNNRLGTGLPFKPGHRKDVEIFLDEEMLLAPLRWKKPRMIFVCSMTDAFAEFVKDEWLDKMFAVMALCPQHTFHVLTKRATRMRSYVTREARERIVVLMWELSEHRTDHIHGGWPLQHVWLGVSAERQQEADDRIPLLLQTPAAVRFISAEPLLGPVDLTQFSPIDANWNPRAAAIGNLIGLDWVIVGGESGHNARPMHPDWARSLRDQCAAAGVPYFFKQWGEFSPVEVTMYEWLHQTNPRYVGERVISKDGEFSGFPCDGGKTCRVMRRLGKKSAGRLLDGKEHNEFPQAKEVVFE